MPSLNPTDLAVLSFLTRSFAELTSMRQIAQQLKLSTAGVYKSLKEFEEQGIVIPEKLGSGLFYRLNFANRHSHHLACIALLSERHSLDIEPANAHDLRAVFANQKDPAKITVIAVDAEKAKEMVQSKIPGKQDIECIAPDVLMAGIASRDKKILAIIKTSDVLFGEDFVVHALKRGAIRL